MTNLPVTDEFQITAVYGQSGSLWASGHKGIDFVSDNRKVYSTCDGTVRVIAYDAGGWGNYVSIGDAIGNRHIFCHLKEGSIQVSVGQKVSRTTQIGIMGDTGNVTGVHLHYQLNNSKNEATDPSGYLGIPNKKGIYNSRDFQIGDSMEYKDKESIADWAKDAVQKVTDAGLMLGDSNGNFNPKSYLTREQAAVILSRLIEKE